MKKRLILISGSPCVGKTASRLRVVLRSSAGTDRSIKQSKDPGTVSFRGFLCRDL